MKDSESYWSGLIVRHSLGGLNLEDQKFNRIPSEVRVLYGALRMLDMAIVSSLFTI